MIGRPLCPLPTRYRTSCTLRETDSQLTDLVSKLAEHVQFSGRKVLYKWLDWTRLDW